MKKISDHQLIEELKRRFGENRTMLMELSSVNKQLKDVNSKLTESEKMKTHFISNIRNEIVNPLSSIISMSDSISNSENTSADEIRKLAGIIYNEAFLLDYQLKNIFASAEIEAGEITFEHFNIDVVRIIKSEIDSYKGTASAKNIEIIFENNLPLDEDKFIFLTDPDKFRMALSNLIINAINWSDGPGKIIIRAGFQNNELKIDVQDFGRGIDKNDLELIFDRFRQIDPNIYTRNKGHGLGLSIVKAYIELMNGKVKVISKLGEGSIFTIIFPIIDEQSDVEGFSSEGEDFLFEDSEIF